MPDEFSTSTTVFEMKRIAYFGGTFDPVHNGHLTIAREIVKLFELDKFYFLPAYHAPHKPERPPTSAFHRFAMLCLATRSEANIAVSTIEVESGQRRYTIDTLPQLRNTHPLDKIFFVMGADSWAEITTWREWETLLLNFDHIVVTRPGYEIRLDHVTDAVRERVVDLREVDRIRSKTDIPGFRIYLTDAAFFDTSATALRDDLNDGHLERDNELPTEVAKYIEKYELYR